MKRVRNMLTKEEGFVVKDTFSCCSEEENLVVYDNTTFGLSTDRSLLQEIPFINPSPNPEGCGSGKGSECCIFFSL